MKRFVILIAVMCVCLGINAQADSAMRFGYLSYGEALKSMPDYAVVQQKLADLRQQFQNETLRVEDEFNRKYEDFLEGQRDFPQTILQKRQLELQQLMEKNIEFKEHGRMEIEKAEQDLMAPLKIRLIEVLGKIGRERGYAFIIDTDVKALPFINPAMIFDSGYGGLTILHGIRQLLPEYDYLYLGDNARAPYGPRSFDVVYEFTRQAVLRLFEMGCHLVILGCNTASAKALRTIQQIDLPKIDPERRVLGVIRPTAEVIGSLTKSRHVGVLATEGTIKSESYNLEIHKLHPDLQVSGVACPFWVPLVEYNEADSPGADYFVKKRIDQIMRLDPQIDTIILGCTHYPLLMPKILKYLPAGVRVIPQGEYVAESLKDYLMRHPQIEQRCNKNGEAHYLTTENPEKFKEQAQIFLHEPVEVENITLG